MSNRAVWDIRQRHEWIAKPRRAKRLKRRTRTRIGLQAAIDRSQPEQAQPSESEAENA